MSFALFPLDPRLTRTIAALGYEVPTPIQREAIPAVLSGRDVLGLAQTGTGKTAAFGLPIIQRLQAPAPAGRPRALVIAPTRELAQQIHDALNGFAAGFGLRSLTLFGGVGLQPQVDALRRGTDIVVACPGRLLDHLARRSVELSAVEVLVLDEADRMFDMGFLPDVRRIVRHLPAARQNLLFSATMPADIRHLADELLRNPVTVQVAHGAPAATVAHALYPVAQHLKTALLLELLRRTDTDSVLVFTRTKHRAKRLGEQLQRAGHSAASLQGNLSQNRRQAAMAGFRTGAHRILVATDIAARGLDVASVSHVINYDMPDTPDAYTHRIGRTGRAARNGDAFTLVTPEDGPMIRDIERLLGAPLERRRLEGFDYGAAAAAEPRPAAVRHPAPRSRASPAAARHHSAPRPSHPRSRPPPARPGRPAPRHPRAEAPRAAAPVPDRPAAEPAAVPAAGAVHRLARAVSSVLRWGN